MESKTLVDIQQSLGLHKVSCLTDKDLLLNLLLIRTVQKLKLFKEPSM